MSRLFNKYVFLVVVLLLLLATGFKVYDALGDPLPRDLNHKNLRKVDAGQEAFSFAVFGDSQNNVTVFNELIDELNREDLDFVIANGDLVFDGQPDKVRRFLRQAEGIDEPLLTAIGNHDTYSNGRTLYYETFGPFYYSFTAGTSYFIVLDTTEEEGPGPTQMDWLRSELEKSRTYENLFVFMHVPLYDTRETGFGLDHDMKNGIAARRLNALLDRYDVTMLFASHIHEYDRGIWGKTPYTITGGAGGQLAGLDKDRYFFHFVKVDVSDSGVEYEVVKLDTPRANILNSLVHDTWIHIYPMLTAHYFYMLVGAGLYVIVFALYSIDRRKATRGSRDGQEAEEGQDEGG